LDAINSASSIQVLAQINSSGNGIEIVDQSGGTGVLKVEEVGGSTARDLNILSSTDGSSIDGSFETIIEITNENNTLQGVRNAINDIDASVKASIVNDGTGINPYHLFITSSHSGSAGRMIVDPELSGGEELEFSSITQPQDAVILLGEKNPLLITESSNTIDEAIAGLTLNLLSADSAKTVQVNVSADLETIKQDIINFIDSYNEIMDFINTQQSYDADTQQTGGVLFGDVNLMNIRNDLRNSVTDSIESSGSITSIFQIGVNVDLTGKLVLDESKLDEVLNNDLEGVKNLFYEETGIAGRVKNYLSSITDATEGLIAYIEDSIQNQNEDYQDRIEAQERLLEIKEEILRRQFTQMEEYLAQMQSQSAWLAMQINSFYSSSSNSLSAG